MITYAYAALAPIQGADLIDAQLSRAHRYKNILIEIENARRVASPPAADDETKETARELANAAIRLERSRCGLYWGTYLLVEESVSQAARTAPPGPLAFARWTGPVGLIGVQIQGGDCDLLTDTRLRLIGCGERVPSADPEAKLGPNPGRLRHVWLRVGSDDRAPIWAVVPIVYHRPLPDGPIKWARLHVGRTGATRTYSVQFVIDAAPRALPPPTPHSVAIDVGWRKMESGVRVAVWMDTAGGGGELRIPQRLLDRWAKVQDLESIRDKNYNGALEWLLAHREAGSWPEWLTRATEHAHAWRSQERLASLVWRWKDQRFDGDSDCYETLEAWRKQDKHLLQWAAHQRANVLLARREIYRLFACSVARYSRVVIEDLDLRDFAELPDVPDDPRTAAARGRRFLAALSTLREAVVYAVRRAGGEVHDANPAGTTRTCHLCGFVGTWDAAEKIEHTCSGCGLQWDQDVNAAENLLRALQCGETKPIRSRTRHEEKTGERAVDARRRKGLATRRAKRSRETAQETGLTTE